MRYAYGVTTALLLGGSALTLATGFPAGAQVAQNDATEMASVVPRAGAPASFADLTQQLQPAVVNISTRQRVQVQGNPFAGTPFEGMFGGNGGGNGGGGGGGGGSGGGATREAQSLGSGFIISADGYVVTNNHVITAEGRGQVESITVTMSDGTEYPATLVGRDAQSDLAVLKIDAGKPLPFVKFGDSRTARVGDWVIAIGNPFGLSGTVTSGIISAMLRNTGSGAYDRFIQTDASINRGNSGGPLFDMKGNVIGINNAIFSPTGGSVGIGFAIPAETAAPIVERLRAGQAIERGYLGLQIQPVDEDLAASLGIPRNRGEFVQTVQPGRAAAAAGIRPGDVVLTIDGKPVTPEQTLSYIVANIAPGKRIPIELMRDGKKLTVNAVVGKRPSDEELATSLGAGQPEPETDPYANPGGTTAGEGLIERTLGLSVIPLTPQLATRLKLPSGTQGLVVRAVDGTSDAGAKGLQQGDLLLSAGGRELRTPADLEAAVRAAQAASRPAVLVRVQRGPQPSGFVPIRIR